MSEEALLLGLDIGGTKCAAVLGTRVGSVVDRVQWASEAQRGPGAMIADLVRNARTLMQRCESVGSIGVAIGGPLDADEGVIHNPPNLPGWEAIPLKQILERELSVTVHVEHDAAACALAEHLWGGHHEGSSLVYLTCGTGFGAGFILDSRIHRGTHGRPSDIGHIRYRDVAPNGPTAYGRAGSLEAFAAGSALPKLAGWKFPQRWGATPPTGQQLAQLAEQDDADACAVLDINARAVGDACALIADMLYPDVILLGSLSRYLGDSWLGAVREQFEREAYPDAARLCRVEPAALGERLQDLSALAAALSR